MKTVSWEGETVLAGKTVQVSDFEFLKIDSISKNRQTGEVLLRGWILVRCTRLGGIMPEELNGVCYVLRRFRNDCRPVWEQSLCRRYLESVVRFRDLIATNHTHPASGVSADPNLLNTPKNLRDIEEYGKLVVRWKRKDCSSASLFESPQTQRDVYRQNTTIGGSEEGQYTFGDVFCGAGGATLGAQTAGLRVKFGVDIDKHSRKTWRVGFAASKHLNMLVDDFAALPSTPEKYQVDILHFSPPCQVFSSSHTITGKDDEKNLAALFSCEGVLRKCKPRVVTLEQTFGITHQKHKIAFRRLLNIFLEQNYSLSWQVVEFQGWGLVQTRRRLILVAAAPGESLPELPPYTHSANPALDGLKPYKSVRRVLAKIEQDAPNQIIPRYSSFQRHTANRGPWDDSGLMPALTTRGSDRCRPDGTRHFTHRELAAIQSFPDHYAFFETHVCRQIGNAVPPLVAKKLFLAVKNHLERVDGMVRMVLTTVID
ncbi:S-adenosyl-L-methionine-dependent methyltransferase [Stipitochalara longipes BDJ]|nr:S-adenosyl-L-methionine-dependent methyltransferase [Stipitochalara longipes BDJ]